MEYKKFGQTILTRIDKGEEIIASMMKIVEKEDIKLAHVSALGAVNDFTVGLFDIKERKYYSNHKTGDHEIISLTGTINTMNQKPYCHIHMSAANREGIVFGGHLNSAYVSATCEMVITLIEGTVDREFNEEIGLNLYKF